MDDHIVLVGVPPMDEFVKAACADADSGVLAQEWRTANRYFRELQMLEAGWVDAGKTAPLSASMLSFVEATLDDPALELAGGAVPYSWQMVELDRLAIYQKRIDVSYVNTLKSTLPAKPSDEDIVRVALAPDLPGAEIHAARLANRAFAFASASRDLRVLDAAMLDAGMISGYRSKGRARKVIALFVGMSVNYLSAIQFRNRLLLTNGSHRACALRQLGVTHAPCLVYRISQEEDLDLMNVNLSAEDRAQFFRGARPPTFKDYFDPRLARKLRRQRQSKQLNIQIAVDARSGPAC